MIIYCIAGYILVLTHKVFGVLEFSLGLTCDKRTTNDV